MKQSLSGPRNRIEAVPLAAALQQVMTALGLEGHYWRQLAVQRWYQVAGPEIAGHTRAAGWQGDNLLIEVDEPVWAQQCSLMAHELIQRLNRSLGRPVVGGMRFVVRGHAVQARNDGPAITGTADSGVPEAELPPQLAKWLQAAENITNPDLSGAMCRWLETQIRKRWRSDQNRRRICASCGAVMIGSPADTSYCEACKLEWRPGGIRARVKDMLREEPWLGYEELSRRLGALDSRIYQDAKDQLLLEWGSRISRWTEKYVVARKEIPARARGQMVDVVLRYACMRAGRRPDQLDNENMLQVGPLTQLLFGRGA